MHWVYGLFWNPNCYRLSLNYINFEIMLKVGDRMPFFEVMDQDGNKFNSLQLLGRKIIIYFYRLTCKLPWENLT